MADLNFAARWPAPLFSANMSSFDFIKDHVYVNVKVYINLDLGLIFQNIFKTFDKIIVVSCYLIIQHGNLNLIWLSRI